MTEINVNEIKALITLLDDPEPDIYNVVRDKIFQLGVNTVPYLEKAWESCLSQPLQQKLENLISEIQYNNVYLELIEWMHNPESCIYGAFIIARFQYPDLKYEMIEQSIAKITKDVWIELNDHLTALEKIRVLNHIFFEIHKFTPNFNNFYAAQNNYINQVLETKHGNPISFAIIYAEIARMAGLPVIGVNLPKNFILAYRDVLAKPGEEEILFYINPYSKGAILGRREIDYFLKQQNITARDEFYKPCSNLDIVKRLINNLINSYESVGQFDKINRLKKLLALFE
jgi:regulator of sirC expression with transglutaminase-like and TPR domain